MAQNNPKLSELTALIESIVAQVLNKSFGSQLTTWATNNSRPSLYLAHETGDRNWGNGAQVAGDLYKAGQLMKQLSGIRTFAKIGPYGNVLSGLSGMYSAYKTGDAIGGAMSGFQLGSTVGTLMKGAGSKLASSLGVWGAVAGLLLGGLFSKKVDRWERPKFKDARAAVEQLFTMDRGERDEYYMPDSFYFRTGSSGARNIVVQVGNDQFDNHIRESLTNNYASQLQRGLVF